MNGVIFILSLFFVQTAGMCSTLEKDDKRSSAVARVPILEQGLEALGVPRVLVDIVVGYYKDWESDIVLTWVDAPQPLPKGFPILHQLHMINQQENVWRLDQSYNSFYNFMSFPKTLRLYLAIDHDTGEVAGVVRRACLLGDIVVDRLVVHQQYQRKAIGRNLIDYLLTREQRDPEVNQNEKASLKIYIPRGYTDFPHVSQERIEKYSAFFTNALGCVFLSTISFAHYEGLLHRQSSRLQQTDGRFFKSPGIYQISAYPHLFFDGKGQYLTAHHPQLLK